MNYLKLCYAIFLLYVMFACSSKTNRVEEGDICIIDYFSLKNRHKAQRKAKFYINKCRSASCMQGGLKQASA